MEWQQFTTNICRVVPSREYKLLLGKVKHKFKKK